MTKPRAGSHRRAGSNSITAAVLYLFRSRVTAQTCVAESMYDAFGQRLHLFATVLTDNPELADQLVIQSIVAHESESSTLQELSAGVYVAWVAWGRPPISSCGRPPTDASPSAQMIEEIHELSEDQRVALGLCKYGGHTYRRAAEVLGLSPNRVASLLAEGLRCLGAPKATRELTVVGA